MADVKMADITEFREGGFLQEVNRTILHPAGLALQVSTGWTDETLDEYLRAHGVQYGFEARSSIMCFVRMMGMDREHISGVWDCRDDPEGIVFGDALDPAKAERVNAEVARHAPVRQERYGYIVQPL